MATLDDELAENYRRNIDKNVRTHHIWGIVSETLNTTTDGSGIGSIIRPLNLDDKYGSRYSHSFPFAFGLLGAYENDKRGDEDVPSRR